ncbi:CsbD family protein [Chromobacterium sphagni]|nr:hypothetical protein [Chromobacterium sphagni]
MSETLNKSSTTGQTTNQNPTAPDKSASNTEASKKTIGYPGHSGSQSTAAPTPIDQDKPICHSALEQAPAHQAADCEDKPVGHAEGAGQTQAHADHCGSTPDQSKHAWKEHISKAKQALNQLTEAELLQTEGDLLKLTIIVQRRYGITHEAAEKQVKTVLDQCL